MKHNLKILSICFLVLLLVVSAYSVLSSKKKTPQSSSSAVVLVTAPKSGETVTGGSTYTINWTAENVPAENKIAISIRRVIPTGEQQEGQEFDPVLFTNLENTGSKEWTVGNSYPAGTYILGVRSYPADTAKESFSAESGEFSIQPAQVVGGDKDTHGCIGSAGYSWCEAKQKCIRVWEEYCTAAEAKTVTFVCTQDKLINATFYLKDDKYVDLDLGSGNKVSLPRTMSASGARYAKADDSFVFWNKGDTATITENQVETYSNCILK